jgi:cytidyltransferase-like protein
MILKFFYKKWVDRSLEVEEKIEVVDRWRSLIEEEIVKESISDYHISILKEVKKYVEDHGGSILFVDRPVKFSQLSLNWKTPNLIIWNNRIIKLFYNLRLLGKDSLKRLTRNYPNPISTTPLFIIPPNKLRKNYMVNEDFENNFVRVENGYRQGLENKFTGIYNSIYLFGTSLVYSLGCEEKDTLSSILENQMNGSNSRVFNRGVLAADVLNSSFAILDTQISKGDIIILYGLNPISEKDKIELKKECNLLDLTTVFMDPLKYGQTHYDHVHLTPAGNIVIAELIVKELKDNFIKSPNRSKNSYSDKQKELFNKIKQCQFRAAHRYIDEGFPLYLNFLKSKFKPGNNGIAVMNCNPFTLGHKHLVSTASKMVDRLYIFVVEEDKSYFPFKQRFEMVKEGLKDIDNVEVVSTGKFLVSSMTFPDYFSKEARFNPAMDVAYDFEIFVNYIAPILELQNRFIGNEPFCKTTEVHHEIMKETLPEKGISVIEIDRKENEFGAISASKVRKLIKNKEFNKLASFLPMTSIDLLAKYEYLN